MLKRYCAAAKHMKDRPEVEMCDESAYPSVRSTIIIIKIEENQEPIAERYEKESMTNNKEDLTVKKCHFR